MKKLKDAINAFLILGYIFMIGALLVDNNYITYNNGSLLILNIILLCIGFYYFIQGINKDE